ncbi:MAG: hypothetical protein Q9175_002219 [Cornicularia normoerica]
MRSQIANRLRSNSTPLNSVPPASTSNDYSTDLAYLAARIIYPSPLPSQNDLPVFILNGAAFPDAKTVDYDALLPYVLSRLPGDEELIGGHGYEVVFFAGAGGNAAMQSKKGRPNWQWSMQAYHVLTRAKRKKLQKLYIVHDKNFSRVLIEVFASVVSPKFRKKVIHISTLSGLALHIPIEDLLIPPSAYLIDRRKSPDIYAPYASGRRAFGVQTPLPFFADRSVRLPRVLRETTSFVIMDDNIKAEGIFRVSARAQTVEILKEAYDRGQKFIVWKEINTVLASSYHREGIGHVWVEEPDHAEGYELHVAAVLIKLWYKELKEPIFPSSSYQALEKYYGNPNVSLEVQHLLQMLSDDDEWSPISSKMSRQILRMHLLPLLSRVAAFQDRNQMTPENLAVCFAPSLLCGPDPIEDLKMSTTVRRILVAMIVHWESDLAPLFGISFETFEESLHMPEATGDREDPLEEARIKAVDETQSVGITLLDNDDSDAEMEIRPALPPRPRAATVINGILEEPNPFDVGATGRMNPANLGLSDGISPVRRKPSPFDDAPLDGMSHIDNGAFTETSPSEIGPSNLTSPIRRKPAPALLPLPRYSSIISDRPAILQGIQYYNTVPIEDDDSGEEHEMKDVDGPPLYEEQVPIYNEPTRPPPCPPPEPEPTRPPPFPPPAAEPSIQRKPLPKMATWGGKACD